MLWLWLWLMLLNQLKLLRDLKLRLKVGVGNIYLALKWNWFQSFVGVRLKIGRKQETLGSKGSLYYLAPAPIVGRSLRSTTYPLKSKMTTSKHVRFQRHLLQSAIPHIRQHGFTVASILASSQVDEKLVRSHFPGPPSSKTSPERSLFRAWDVHQLHRRSSEQSQGANSLGNGKGRNSAYQETVSLLAERLLESWKVREHLSNVSRDQLYGLHTNVD